MWERRVMAGVELGVTARGLFEGEAMLACRGRSQATLGRTCAVGGTLEASAGRPNADPSSALVGGKLRYLQIKKLATSPKCGDCHIALPGVRPRLRHRPLTWS